ncbi:MAG TPA: hypothetical protein VK563_12105 [Puia sp.]|nr:hypothetical protein [Puia sp.]
MKRRQFLRNTFGLGLLALPGPGRLNPSIDLRSIISRGDIHRAQPPDPASAWVLLYQGNGRFGSCFGPWGLHSTPDVKSPYTLHGATRFTHIKHFVRGRFNADYLLPIGTMYWATEPDKVITYDQYQSFYDGTLTTRFSTSDYTIRIISWFDAVRKDIAGFQIEVTGKSPVLLLSTPRSVPLIYDQRMTPVIEERLKDNHYEASIRCLDTHSSLKVSSDAEMIQGKEGLELRLRQGLNTILMAVNSELTVSAGESLRQTRQYWHRAWEKAGWLDLPDERAQKVWVRSLAYTLYSHNDDGFGCSPPTGLAGNGWPFPFPFDSGCRHPLLLMTGQTETARKWVECWHSRLDGLKEYTQRFFKGEGVFLPHVFPYGQAYGYHDPQPPNKYYYPIYNSSLLVRIADQTSVMVNDREWTKAYAEPLIHEAAKFYLSHLKKGADGLWHLHIIPSISLDESGDTDKPDYVSGLISAQYSLQKAVEYGLDTDNRMKAILSDGFGYPALLAGNGMYHNHLDPAIKDFGRQKHPDQLFALVHTPLGPSLDKPHRRAHELRYETTEGAKEPRFLGHTLGEFILASARMHDPEAWLKDWGMLMPARYMDPDLIQFYESTGNSLAFYITTHGLFAQALLETTVSTWWDRLDLGSCIPWKGNVRFGNIRTLLGVTVNGEIKDGRGQAVLTAWKDTSFTCQGRTIDLKKGGKTTVKINPYI